MLQFQSFSVHFLAFLPTKTPGMAGEEDGGSDDGDGDDGNAPAELEVPDKYTSSGVALRTAGDTQALRQSISAVAGLAPR